jgi:very-short-patch-repair endonuclease
MGGLPLMREYRFHRTRLWRFDFALPEIRVAIEVEGHKSHRGSRFSSDAHKYNTAQMAGWTVIRLSYDMIERQHVGPVIDYCQRRMEEFRTKYTVVRAYG